MPISREVGVERRAVIFKLELLCCRMIGSYPGEGGGEYRENGEQLHFGCGKKKGNYASVV